MKVIRIIMVIFIVSVVSLMVVFPRLYDSKRRFSWRHQRATAERQHELTPSIETQREFEAARLGVEEANRLDKREIIFFEIFMLGILGVSIYGFIQTGKNVRKISTS